MSSPESSNLNRSRGRVIGQEVAPYCSKDLDGDVVVLAKIINGTKGEVNE